MRALALAGLLAACGDNLHPIAPPLAHADAMFMVGHPDDEMIFMEPELLAALAAGSVTTIYATTAGPTGVDHHLYDSTLVAYGATLGASDWDCGALDLGVGVIDHCRNRERAVSVINLDLPDGGIPGDRPDSLLHLVDGTTPTMPLWGPDGGTITMPSVIAMFQAVLEATTPGEIHTLDLAATHGRDHSSHLFVASFTLWAAARTGYAGPVTWHRGYNVEPEVPTLDDADIAAATAMLGVYEACADDNRPCGPPDTQVLPEHATWLARQYSTARVTSGSGQLALGDQCLDATLALGDCAIGAQLALTAAGTLQLGGMCVASTDAGGIALAACAPDPSQYWLLDGEGFVSNGRPPAIGGDMSMDHVRCLSPGAAGTCGSQLHPAWQFR